MKLRPAIRTDRDLLATASAALRRKGEGDHGWEEAVADGIVVAYVLEARSGRAGVAYLSVSRVGRDERRLWIVGGYSPPGATDVEVRQALAGLRILARRMGCNGVSFTGQRPGWRRRAPQLGFEPGATIYNTEAV